MSAVSHPVKHSIKHSFELRAQFDAAWKANGPLYVTKWVTKSKHFTPRPSTLAPSHTTPATSCEISVGSLSAIYFR